MSTMPTKQIHLLPVSGLPALCVCVRAACGASATSEKTRPGILEHVSCGICNILSILGSLQAPWGLCACRRRLFFLKKHAPGFLEHVFCGCCRCLSILLKIGRPLPRNVSNSRNCIQKSSFWNLPAGPAGPSEVVSWSAARTLPSTRAGGQDDVSFTNSLK